MVSDLYSGKILAAAANIPARRRLEKSSARAFKESRICGSSLDLDVIVKDGVVTDYGLDARACALGQAAASIVAQNLIGARLDEFEVLRDQIYHMLKENGSPPSAPRWQELDALLGVRDYAPRHGSVMLIFEALADIARQLRGPDGANEV